MYIFCVVLHSQETEIQVFPVILQYRLAKRTLPASLKGRKSDFVSRRLTDLSAQILPLIRLGPPHPSP